MAKEVAPAKPYDRNDLEETGLTLVAAEPVAEPVPSVEPVAEEPAADATLVTEDVPAAENGSEGVKDEPNNEGNTDFTNNEPVVDTPANEDPVVDENAEKYALLESENAELKNKLSGIAEGAEVNVVKSVKDTDFVLSAEGQLQLKDTVTTALNAVANKVDKEEGKSLVSDTEIAKLLTVKQNAEPNYVKSVDAQFEVNAEGQLSLKELAQDKISGLTTALEGKVDKVEGKGLSENDFTDAFVKKLNAINLENIQANVIEKITLNGVETQVVEKTVDIPLATTTQFGLVKGSNAENEVAVKADGIMSVNALNIQKLSQTEGETLVLDCGKA